MKLQRKGTRHSHRGVIGVESAIVMIAFVIVAAALAFVVLNMGFQTSQKAKTTIIAGLEESGSSMQVAGKVIGVGCTVSGKGCGTTPYLNATAFPIKITSGGDSVDLGATTTAVKYISNAIQYDDIYAGPITAAEYRSLSLAFDQADSETGSAFDDFNNSQPLTGAVVANTGAFIYWSVQLNQNAVLDQGEHAILVVAFEDGERPTSLDTIRAELIPATGASLTVERQVPTITSSIVDLG